MASVVTGVVWFFPKPARLANVMEQKWPVKAVAYLKAHPAPQPMFNTYGYGGFLIWQMDGQNKVFVDGRADIYERTGVLADYLAIARVQVAAPQLLKAYGVQSCLISRDEALRTLLDVLPGWQRVYSDDLSVLFVRRGAGLDTPPTGR